MYNSRETPDFLKDVEKVSKEKEEKFFECLASFLNKIQHCEYLIDALEKKGRITKEQAEKYRKQLHNEE